MLVKNWMHKNPVTISSDMLAAEAKAMFDEHHLPFIPVVDGGTLRGILARRDIREAASCVTASQSIHEVNFFNTRLKVKDLMVRKPVTLSVDDTVETALIRGKEFSRSFFPIMEGEKLVGTISDRDLSSSMYQILGVAEKLSGISVELDQHNGHTLKNIIEALCLAGVELHRFFTMADPETKKKRLLLRFEAKDMDTVVTVTEKSGFHIIEKVHSA